MPLPPDTRLGAVPRPDGTVEFRVWAPPAERIDLRIGGESRPLAREAGGTWAAAVRAAPGDDYTYVVDGDRELPDPCSRYQPLGILGPSRVTEPPGVAALGLSPEELVVYELHVGAFSEEGTFDGVVPHLAALRDLGATAIELMPVVTVPADH